MEVTQMPSQKDTRSGPATTNEGGLLSNLILLTLPLLSFHRDVLATVKASLETHKDDHIKAMGNLISFELHALLMAFDPARKFRDCLDGDLERKFKDELTKILEKLAAGLIGVVEVQVKILPTLIEALKATKNGGRAAPNRTE
jgi:hypothetical protein